MKTLAVAALAAAFAAITLAAPARAEEGMHRDHGRHMGHHRDHGRHMGRRDHDHRHHHGKKVVIIKRG